MLFCWWEWPCDIQAPITTPWDICTFLALLSKAALQKSKGRGTADVSTSCRSCDGTAQLGKLDIYGDPFWDSLSHHYYFSLLMVSLHLRSGHIPRVGFLCCPKKRAVQVSARGFHFSLFALTMMSQGNIFGILLVPCLWQVSQPDGTWQHCWCHRADSHRTWGSLSSKPSYF